MYVEIKISDLSDARCISTMGMDNESWNHKNFISNKNKKINNWIEILTYLGGRITKLMNCSIIPFPTHL